MKRIVQLGALLGVFALLAMSIPQPDTMSDRTVVLLRHAKSSWAYDYLNDIERPLNKRGVHDADLIGDKLKGRGFMPDVIVSSPSVRTYNTITIIANRIGYSMEKIVFDPTLYAAPSSNYLEVIRGLDEDVKTVVLVGHNPAMTDLANKLSDQEFENVPTTGTVSITFKGKSWQEVPQSVGTVDFFEYPKLYYDKYKKK